MNQVTLRDTLVIAILTVVASIMLYRLDSKQTYFSVVSCPRRNNKFSEKLTSDLQEDICQGMNIFYMGYLYV